MTNLSSDSDLVAFCETCRAETPHILVVMGLVKRCCMCFTQSAAASGAIRVDLGGAELPQPETPATLDALLDQIDAGEWSPESGRDWSSMPTFGGEEPDDTIEVWSWDADRLLVGSDFDVKLVTRAEWEQR